MPNIAPLVSRPTPDVVKSDQLRPETNPVALLLAPDQDCRWILRLDRPRCGEPLTKPPKVRALGHQITSFSASITVSTSWSFRCGYIGKEKIFCALPSATG